MYQAHFLIVFVLVGLSYQVDISVKCQQNIQNNQGPLKTCQDPIYSNLENKVDGVTDSATVNNYVCQAIGDLKSCYNVLKVNN